MLPTNAFSSVATPAPFLAPDDRVRDSLLTDYEVGGIALSDPSEGMLYQVWTAWADENTGTVYCAPELGGSPATLFTAPGITELSLTFDQNMRACVAFVQAGVTNLWWFDSYAATMVITSFAGAESPMVSLDDKRPLQTGSSDILFFYLRGGQIFYRQQRDQFGVERYLADAPANAQRIDAVGMNTGGRMQLLFHFPDAVEAVTCGALESMLDNLNRPFEKAPMQELAFRFSYDGAMTWELKYGTLTTSVVGGSGLPLSVDISQHSIKSLVGWLNTQTGYTAQMAATAQQDLAAATLIDSSGNIYASNGDHVYRYSSLLWAYLSAVAVEICLAEAQIVEMLAQMQIDTASGEYLDFLGDFYGVPRILGETDARYAKRIIVETLREKGNNLAIAAAVEAVLGQPVTVTDAPAVIVSDPLHYWDGTYSFDGTIDFLGGGGSARSSYGLFDVALGFDLLGDTTYVDFQSAVVDQVNRLRDAGTFLRQLTISGASPLLDDDTDVETDSLILTVSKDSYWDGSYLFDGTVSYGSLSGTSESL